MPRTGRPKEALELTDEERKQLLRWSRRAKSAQSLALRSRIVVASADGVDNKAVADKLGCSPSTVLLPTPSAHATTMRERNANDCADFARRDQRSNCLRSSSVSSNASLGRPVLGITKSTTYPLNLRRDTLGSLHGSHNEEHGRAPRSGVRRTQLGPRRSRGPGADPLGECGPCPGAGRTTLRRGDREALRR